MKTIKRIIFGIICLFSITACSQKIDEAGKISRQKAELFIDNNLKNETENNKYIIFSVSDKNF
ncbi:MAG: hypothetical protein GKR88_07575 [Flavobacteriaceae bacterium]|nr:MAG: hypothetical protein GKR88_07575 [Flavobacteriaceae bacterium]